MKFTITSDIAIAGMPEEMEIATIEELVDFLDFKGKVEFTEPDVRWGVLAKLHFNNGGNR